MSTKSILYLIECRIVFGIFVSPGIYRFCYLQSEKQKSFLKLSALHLGTHVHSNIYVQCSDLPATSLQTLLTLTFNYVSVSPSVRQGHHRMCLSEKL